MSTAVYLSLLLIFCVARETTAMRCSVGYKLEVFGAFENGETEIKLCDPSYGPDVMCRRVESDLSYEYSTDFWVRGSLIHTSCEKRSACQNISCDSFKELMRDNDQGINVDGIQIDTCQKRCCEGERCNEQNIADMLNAAETTLVLSTTGVEATKKSSITAVQTSPAELLTAAGRTTAKLKRTTTEPTTAVDSRTSTGVRCSVGYKLVVPGVLEAGKMERKACETSYGPDAICGRVESAFSYQHDNDFWLVGNVIYTSCEKRRACKNITCESFEDLLRDNDEGFEVDRMQIDTCKKKCCEGQHCNEENIADMTTASATTPESETTAAETAQKPVTTAPTTAQNMMTTADYTAQESINTHAKTTLKLKTTALKRGTPADSSTIGSYEKQTSTIRINHSSVVTTIHPTNASTETRDDSSTNKNETTTYSGGGEETTTAKSSAKNVQPLRVLWQVLPLFSLLLC